MTAVWLILELNMSQATERFPQAPPSRKIDKNMWLHLSPDVNLSNWEMEVFKFHF